ncbi:Elongation_factor 1-alpha [Hexamita inflata]|uniref:Elongation factor 1-alpha n=1 Tax=Hexamita inflata TaxID=28002 RepID=A0ABP1GLZ4_9EUKA
MRKNHINIVVIGHVDNGKSTLAGHLIYKCGDIDKSILVENERKANKIGKGFLKYAWVLDQLYDERKRGITINISLQKIETKKFIVTIIDTPGHRDFIQNMISGSSQADVAILVVSSIHGEFEAGISNEGQTREHAILALTLGIKTIIVAVNKMDKVNYSETRYTEIKTEMQKTFKLIGYKHWEDFDYIPLSGQEGDNIIETSANTPWYNGKSLVECIDSLKVPKHPNDKPLRISIQDVYKVKGVGTVPVGRVESGELIPGMKIVFAPAGLNTEVRSIEMHHQNIEKAIQGDYIGFNIMGLCKFDLKRGYVAGDINNDAPKGCEYFKANVIIINHPTKICPGYTPTINCHTTHITCKFDKFLAKLNFRTFKVETENPTEAYNGECILIKIVPTKPLCIESFDQYPALGRFAVRDMRCTVAIGIVTEVFKKEQ